MWHNMRYVVVARKGENCVTYCFCWSNIFLFPPNEHYFSATQFTNTEAHIKWKRSWGTSLNTPWTSDSDLRNIKLGEKKMKYWLNNFEDSCSVQISISRLSKSKESLKYNCILFGNYLTEIKRSLVSDNKCVWLYLIGLSAHTLSSIITIDLSLIDYWLKGTLTTSRAIFNHISTCISNLKLLIWNTRYISSSNL